jgi:hypothetical protein
MCGAHDTGKNAMVRHVDSPYLSSSMRGQSECPKLSSNISKTLFYLSFSQEFSEVLLVVFHTTYPRDSFVLQPVSLHGFSYTPMRSPIIAGLSGRPQSVIFRPLCSWKPPLQYRNLPVRGKAGWPAWLTGGVASMSSFLGSSTSSACMFISANKGHNTISLANQMLCCSC